MTPTKETPLHLNLSIGIVIGAVEAWVSHPLWTLKTLLQQGKPLVAHPRVLYRGVTSHAASSVPLDMVQTAASRIFYEHPAFTFIPKATRRLIAGGVGGCFGALISSPAEMIMIRQLDKSLGVKAACKDLWKEGGIRKIYAGIGSTLGRDSIFCCGFFAGVPILRNEFECYTSSPPLASISAGILSGIFTAVLSQPFDTIKTSVQSSSTLTNSFSASRKLVAKSGFKGLYNGLSLRIARVTLGILILGTLNDKLEDVILNKQYN